MYSLCSASPKVKDIKFHQHPTCIYDIRTDSICTLHYFRFLTFAPSCVFPISIFHFVVHCEVGERTERGTCVRKRSIEANRKREETRDREVLLSPGVSGDPSLHVTDLRRCAIKKNTKKSAIHSKYSL